MEAHKTTPTFAKRLFRLALWLGLAGLLLALVGAGAAAYLLVPELRRYDGQVQALRARKELGQGWLFHSRLYSAHYPLEPDMLATVDLVVKELEVRGYEAVKKAKQPLEPGQYRKTPQGLEAFLRGYDLNGAQGPSGQVSLKFKGDHLKTVTPLEGTAGGQTFAIEPIVLGELMGDPPRRATYVPLARIPAAVRNAVVASEDSRFMTHHGLDFRGIARAASRNMQAGEVKQGGSTITQQLARTLFLSTERTYQRKVSELAIALLLDRRLSKDELLELYLNSVYLGQQDGVALHGVAEAARAFFNTPVEALTVAQAATLSAIIPAPNAFSPVKNPSRALERRNRVLDLMVEQGMLKMDEAREAKAEKLETSPGRPSPLRYGYYTSYVRDYLKEKLGPGFELKGLTIHSALDPVVQEEVEKSLIREVEARERHFGKQAEPLQGAAFLMDHQTGRVLAVVGGRGYDENPFNRAFQSHRQPGSAFKPIAYAAALDGGEGAPSFTPGSTVPDMRKTFQVKEGDWKPRNYESDYHETATLAKALTKSLNVATVNLVEQIGPQRVVDLARKMGLGEPKPVLSIGLVTSEVTLDHLTAAYATFPSGGLKVEPQPVLKVVDLWGSTVLESRVPSERLLKVHTAQLMVDLLRSVVIYGTSWTLRTEGYYPRPSAGKTGTTQNENDAWYIGFTTDVILGVWVGFDSPRHLYGSAADVAVPVWGGVMTDFMKHRPSKEFDLPEDLEYVWIDPYTGGTSTSACPRTMRVAFVKGTKPKFACPKSHEGEHVEEEGEGEEGESEAGESEAPPEALPPDATAPSSPPAAAPGPAGEPGTAASARPVP